MTADEDIAGLDPDAMARFRRSVAIAGSAAGAEGRAALAGLAAGGPATVRDPARWVPWVDAARRVWSLAGRPPHIPGLPPCLQLSLRPVWPAASVDRPTDARCAAAGACPAELCPHTGPAPVTSPLRPLRHTSTRAAVSAAVAAVHAAWDHGPSSAALDWLQAMQTINGPLARPDRLEFSLKRVGGQLAPRLRMVDLDPGATDAATGTARRARIADWLAEQMPAPAGEAARQFIDLFAAHHGPRAGLSVGVDAPLASGRPRLQLYAHQGGGEPRADRAHLLAALRWSGAAADDIERMAAFVADRAVALVVFAPSPGDPRGIKVYVGAPFELARPLLGLSALSPPDYAGDSSLVVWRCGVGGLRWEKRDFRSAAHPQRSAAIVADFVRGLTADDSRRARALLDGQAFLPWFTWISVRPGAHTVYFHAR